MVQGINHITISVEDLGRSFRFYTQILGLRPLALWEKGAYLLAGENWICLTLDIETRKKPFPEYSHTAFTVSKSEFELLSARVRRSGAKQWHDNESEGASLYFLDPDNHKLEIHVGDWKSRIDAIRKNPVKGMIFFD